MLEVTFVTDECRCMQDLKQDLETGCPNWLTKTMAACILATDLVIYTRDIYK